MNYAERIYERVKSMPERLAAEVMDFAEFLAARNQLGDAGRREDEFASRRAAVARDFDKYRIDLTGYRFDREEANARR